MKRPLSQLIYTRVQEGRGSPRIITLHPHNQFSRGMRDVGLAAGPDARIIGLESYKGVFVGRSIVGYTWFIGPDDGPSPLYFGDALAEIERFLWDEVGRQRDQRETRDAELPFLLGVGQGAIMALATAAAVPDLLSGVIAIDGSFPIVPGWQPPLAPLDGLPVLLLSSARTGPTAPEKPAVLIGEALVTTLTCWGAVVTQTTITPGEIPAAEMSVWLTAQAVRRIATAQEQATIG